MSQLNAPPPRRFHNGPVLTGGVMRTLSASAGGELPAPDKVDNYVVMVANPVVLRDLCETILDYDPTAKVYPAITFAEACAAITGLNAIARAFLEACPIEVAQAGLVALVEAKGGRLVRNNFV